MAIKKQYTCNECGLTLPISEFRDPGHSEPVCIDCTFRKLGHVPCSRCNKNALGPSDFGSTQKTSGGLWGRRSKICRSCSSSAGVNSATAKKKNLSRSQRIKRNKCECGNKAIEQIAGKYLCYQCMCPDNQPKNTTEFLATQSHIGNYYTQMENL